MNFLGPFFHAESNSHTWILHQDQSDPEIDEEKRWKNVITINLGNNCCTDKINNYEVHLRSDLLWTLLKYVICNLIDFRLRILS